MSFSSQITRSPIAFDPDLADDTLAKMPGFSGEMAGLLHATAGCSPFLSMLMKRHPEWLEKLALGDPDRMMRQLCEELTVGASKDVSVDLRRAKQKASLLIALADLGGVWELDKVTSALTDLADRALDIAFKTALSPLLNRGKLAGRGPDDLETAGGLVALAMGKMGAFELNYSSDIDIICLFDDSRMDAMELAEARPVFVKTVRQAMGLLSDKTAEGYVFRTDLRLRPEPSVTAVAIPLSAAERYYEGVGRTWERAAFVKARPCAGDCAVGDRFLRDIRPFIWRRHLDYTAVEDAHDIRQKIRAHKTPGGGTILEGRNVKLGGGGIREIEFFAQTRQLIVGGRDPDLRVRGTREALRRLTKKGWVEQEDAAQLDTDYVRLREIEHRLQMVQDAQTHDLPTSADGWQRLACFAGTGDVETLKSELLGIFDRVHNQTEPFFAPTRAPQSTGPLDEGTERIVERWRSYPALRSPRGQEIFTRLLPDLLAGFQRSARPEEAILQFDGFLRGLPAGVQLFALFEANPQLIELMVDISSTSPALARYLSVHSGVLDAVIGGVFFEAWPGRAALENDLSTRLGDPELDYEQKLDAARHWQKDWHFRIGVHHLRGLIPPPDAADEYSDVAEVTVAQMWKVVCTEFARRHGPLPGRGAAVVGMGSLGAQQLTARSDLDLIVIFDADGDDTSDGPRPLPARTYYARLTKALVTALSSQTAAGTLYEVDMRLRPSGRQGPAATSWAGYQNYQMTEAWTWEHLAQTRARVLAGDAGLAEDIEAFRQRLLKQPHAADKVLRDLADMRRRLADAKPKRSVWDVSNGPGGLQDIELLAQTMALFAGSPKRGANTQLTLPYAPLAPDEAETLLNARRLLAAVKFVAALLTDQPLDPENIGYGGQAVLLRDTGQPDLQALEDALEQATRAAGKVIDRLVPAAQDTDQS